jgi:hypothetical protein
LVKVRPNEVKWLLPIAFLAVGLEAGTVGAGYLLRRVEGPVFVMEGSASVTEYKGGFGDPFPADLSCFARKGSKLELIGQGKTLRFGDATAFTLRSDGPLQLHQGSVLIYSRRPDIRIQVDGPSVTAVVSGEGVVMLEITTNGGFKLVGLIGAMQVEERSPSGAAGSPTALEPGELVFLKPLGNGFGDKLNVRLRRLCSTSRLVRGYGNPTHLRNHLLAAVEWQDRRIVRSYGLVVGDAPGLDRFETFPLPPQP